MPACKAVGPKSGHAWANSRWSCSVTAERLACCKLLHWHLCSLETDMDVCILKMYGLPGPGRSKQAKPAELCIWGFLNILSLQVSDNYQLH